MHFSQAIDDKLALVIPEVSAAKEIFALIAQNRDDLKTWIPIIGQVLSPNDVAENLTKRIQDFETGTAAAFYATLHGKFIGSVGLTKISQTDRHGHIGYWLLPEYRGQGLMTKCVKACLDYDFTKKNLNKITIVCSKENIASAAIPERLGFTLEGNLRQEKFLNGTFHDFLVFGLLREEWEEKSL